MGVREQVTAFTNAVESGDLNALLLRLASVTVDLISAHRELGQLLRAEAQGRSTVHMQSMTETVSGRDREADVAVLDLHMDIVELKSTIEAYNTEVDALKTILSYRGHALKTILSYRGYDASDAE